VFKTFTETQGAYMVDMIIWELGGKSESRSQKPWLPVPLPTPTSNGHFIL